MKPNLNEIKLSKAINEAKEAEKNWIMLSWQILITAGVIGMANESWVWFSIALVSLFILLRIPYLGALLCLILGSFIGLAAGGIAGALGGKECGWTIGIILGLVMISINLNGRFHILQD